MTPPYTSIINPNVKLNTPQYLGLFFDQYKLFIDTTGKSADQRRNLNMFYLTVNTLVMSAIGTLATSGYIKDKHFFLLGILMFVGIATTMSWISAIHVYKTMNNKNYAIIREFEQYFPAQVYTSFNKDLSKLDSFSEGKIFLTQREIIIPYVFLIGYVLYALLKIMKAYFLNV